MAEGCGPGVGHLCSLPLSAVLLPAACCLADVSWKALGVWAIDTSNPNSWASAETAILPRSAADAILLQETMLAGQTGEDRACRRGRVLGWS